MDFHNHLHALTMSIVTPQQLTIIQYNTIQYIHNWPLPIGAFQGQWNTTKQQNRTITTTVKNPNWPEANQLAIDKCSWEVEPGTTRIQFNEWSERVLNPGSPDLKASALTTGPHWLLRKAPKWFTRRSWNTLCSYNSENIRKNVMCLFTIRRIM